MNRLIICLRTDAALKSMIANKDAIRQRFGKPWRRARIRPSLSDYNAYVAQCLGVDWPKQPPLAALSALAMSPDTPREHSLNQSRNQWYAYLDPVHMVVDRDQLLMLGNDTLNIDTTEAEQICHDLSEFYADENWHLEPISAKQWLLRLPQRQNINVSDLQQVLGCNVFEHMPSGADAATWRKTLNEIQMFLHNHVCNQRRQAQGQAQVNSVWLWGSGCLSDLPEKVRHPPNKLFSNDNVTRGLAHYYALECQPLPDSVMSITEQSSDATLLLGYALSGGDHPAQAWAQWQQQYLQVFLSVFQNGQLDELRLYIDNGYELTLKPGILQKMKQIFT